MKKLIEKTGLTTTYEVTSLVVERNLDAAKEIVDAYLKSNKIGDYYYTCEYLTESTTGIRVGLERVGDWPIDEDFDSDENWDAFCASMEERLKVFNFSVPYWYYAK